MKTTIQAALRVLILTFCVCQMAEAQTQVPGNWTPKDRNLNVEMLFPGGKSKALILSYDDGPVEDRRLVRLLNKYNLKGTFHLNSGKFGMKGIIGRDEVATIYVGHEVSVHGYNHIGMKDLSAADLFYEAGEDRRMLETISGRHVRGMAYPFGAYREGATATLASLGFEYARTVNDTYEFGIPENPLLWHPTAHKFAKLDYEGNSPEVNKAENENFTRLTDDFLNSKGLALYYVWGHSWEYTKKWDKVEEFFKAVANREDIAYLTHIELVDYLNAFKRLKVSADKKNYLNVSSVDVFIKVIDYKDLEKPKTRMLRIPPGKSLSFS